MTGKWGEIQGKLDELAGSSSYPSLSYQGSTDCTSKPFRDHTLTIFSNSRTFNDFLHDRFQFSTTSGLAVTCKI